MWVFSVKQGLESVPQLASLNSPLRGSQMPSEASVAFFLLQVPPKRGQRLAPLDTVCHVLRKSEESEKLFNFSLDFPEIGCILGADAEVLRLSPECAKLSDSVAAGGRLSTRRVR